MGLALIGIVKGAFALMAIAFVVTWIVVGILHVHGKL